MRGICKEDKEDVEPAANSTWHVDVADDEWGEIR